MKSIFVKLTLTAIMVTLAFLISCSHDEIKKEVVKGDIDRTVLPILPPKHESIKTFNARDAKAPERFKVTAPNEAPNVIVILLDDIGYGATETFGGGINTPVFNKLADNGLKYTRFHTTALCSPTRASLLSGRNHHNVNVGSVMEIATAFPGNNGERPEDAKYVAEILRQNGYSTAAFGKWHETAPWEVSVAGPYFRWPTNSGFDKFYGFIGGETNQWDPIIYDGVTKVEKKKDPNYHFTTDMTDEAINWMKFQKALVPEKPFFMYFATGATHAPHHAPKSYIDKYKGQFDDGWDALREQTLARQKKMGIVPQNAKLPPKPEGLLDWESLSEEEKQVFTTQMETFAGFTEHTDYEIGRLINSVEEIGQLENTIIVYIMGDNGSSAEGGIIGTYNEMIVLNGLQGQETTSDMSSKLDKWGGPESYPHFSAAWATATDAPFKWTKQIAGDFGGTRNGMVLHWPRGIKSKGENRAQFAHVNDIVPTILEATKIPAPNTINGVKQKDMDGISLIYSFDNPNAKEKHTTQYFEMFGNRAIYHDGWLARVVHSVPWVAKPLNTLENDKWELYDTQKDYALTNDLSNSNPEKLEELKLLFEKEAIANNVYPIDDRRYERFNPAVAGRPDLMGNRKSLTLSQGMTGIMENTFINVKNRSFNVTADVNTVGNDHGVIISQGGQFAGWSLYVNDGKPEFTYNWFGMELYTIKSDQKLSKGKHTIMSKFIYDGDGMGKGGSLALYVDGNKVGEGRVDKTVPAVFSGDETADVGVDEATQVAHNVFKNVNESEFSGYVNTVTVSIE